MPSQFRQGDVLVEPIAELPAGAEPRDDDVLFSGELSGHSHRVEPRGAARVLRAGDALFVVVEAPGARMVHEEHAPIELPPGLYRVWRQREYSPRGTRDMRD